MPPEQVNEVNESNVMAPRRSLRIQNRIENQAQAAKATATAATDLFLLPDELFQMIFKYLPWSSIKSCRLVSTKWKALVDCPGVLSCAAMNVIYPDMEKRLRSNMSKFVGKVNLKQLCDPKVSNTLFKKFSDFLDENVTEAEGYLSRLAEVTKIHKDLPIVDFPYLVASLVRTRPKPCVSVYIEIKKISVSGTVANMMKLINGILNDELKVETLCWDDFDLVNIDDGDDVTFPDIDWKQYGEEVEGPEFFMEPLAKAVCKCKEVVLMNSDGVGYSTVGPWQPKIINAIFTALTTESKFNVSLRKLSLNFSPDYEIGSGNVHADSGAPGLEANVFAEAVCKLEEVNFCSMAICPTLEEALFQKIHDTPTDQQTLKSLQISYVTTKPKILAFAAVKLTNLELYMGDYKRFCPSHYDQCAQAKAILDKIHKVSQLQLRTLEVRLCEDFYKRSKWSYPKKKMEMIEAKMEKVEIYDGTQYWDPDSPGINEDYCSLQ